MAGLYTVFLCLAITVLVHGDHPPQHSIPSDEENEVTSHEVVGTGAHSSSITDGETSNQNSGIYILRRQRRSPHIGSLGGHFYQRPVYVQPVAVAPVHGGYYPAGGHYYPPAQPPQYNSNSHSQAQAISASFGNGGNNHNFLGGGGGGSSISAAAASSGSGTSNDLRHPQLYGRK